MLCKLRYILVDSKKMNRDVHAVNDVNNSKSIPAKSNVCNQPSTILNFLTTHLMDVNSLISKHIFSHIVLCFVQDGPCHWKQGLRSVGFLEGNINK